jgi:hypothetical protein
VAGNIFLPHPLDGLAAVEVELALNDLPDRWICFCDAPHRDPIGSVPAVLRGILFRIGLEHLKVFPAGKVPRGSHP